MRSRKLFHLSGLLALLLLLPGHAFAQNLRVHGRVLDETGEGLIGAGVVLQGTTNGTITDMDGNFVLPSVPRGATLEISCIGYATQAVQVTGPSLTVTLEPESRALDEAVVIAYGQQKKVTITGAVSAVGSDELLKAPVANVANALQGNLPGVSAVQASGMPGADEPVIRIRGVGSLNSAEPLVLVDGVERSFSQLDPNEIESISVLKDASATAVFGVRGANGVILVTTKRGTTGKASVTASANSAVQTISKFVEFADSYTYGKLWNYTAITDALPMTQWPGTASISDYSQYSNTGIRFSQEVMEHFRTGDMPTTFPNMDWINYIMNDAAWQEQANVNVNGGTERVRYFVSAGFLNQDSLFKTFSDIKNETFNYKRLNYRANLDIDVSKYSQLSITVSPLIRPCGVVPYSRSRIRNSRLAIAALTCSRSSAPSAYRVSSSRTSAAARPMSSSFIWRSSSLYHGWAMPSFTDRITSSASPSFRFTVKPSAVATASRQAISAPPSRRKKFSILPLMRCMA